MLCLCAVFIFCSMAQAVEFGGINIPDNLQVGSEKLVLNGVGMREKYFIDLYVGALYLTKKSSDAQKIINEDTPMAITVHIISGLITEERMADATEDGFKSTTGGKISKAFQEDIDLFIDAFSKSIKKGDFYQLIYIPDKGVTVWKNGKATVTVKGLEFKKVLFAIWIGKKATVNKALNVGMLGSSKK